MVIVPASVLVRIIVLVGVLIGVIALLLLIVLLSATAHILVIIDCRFVAKRKDDDISGNGYEYAQPAQNHMIFGSVFLAKTDKQNEQEYALRQANERH